MENLWDMYKSKIWLESFLIYAICLSVIVSACLFIFLLFIKLRKIKEDKLKVEYTELVEQMMLQVVFAEGSFIQFKDNAKYARLFTKKSFRDQMMQAVMNLHLSYEGIYAKRLEAFYFESHLITDSFGKMKDSRWEVNCQAIEELSEMKVTTIFDHLVEISKSSNNTLKTAAIKGCIKLNGTKGLTHLIRHKQALDLWIQVSIINALQQGNIEHTEGIDLLLNSKNHTVVSLGLKIIQTLQLSQYSVDILRMMNTTENKTLKQEGQSVLDKIKNHIPLHDTFC